MARDAIALYLEGLVASSEPIPEETMHPAAIPLEVVVPEVAFVGR